MTTDWRTNLYDDKSDMKYFTDEIEVHIRKLYPQVKRLLWLPNVVRGGQQFRDQPITAAKPHLDFHQNKSLISEFHNRVGPPIPKQITNLTAGNIIMGQWDNEEEKFGKFKIINLEKWADVVYGWPPRNIFYGICDLFT